MTTDHSKISPAEILRSKEKTRQALASLRLEGITPSQEMINDFELCDAGKITVEEVKRRTFIRLKLPVPMDHGI